MTNIRYGMVGLGELGAQLANNLLKNGFEVALYDTRQENMQALKERGGKPQENLKNLTQNCDAIITCLPSPAITKAVWDEILMDEIPENLTMWIDMGTNSADEITAIAQKLAPHNIESLAAPITGGVHRAASAKIAILVGGDEALYQQHLPALQAMGHKIFHLGGIEQASVTKVVTNMLAFIHLIAAGEAMMLCKLAGVEESQAFAAIAASSGTSFVHETETQMVLSGSYDIAFTLDLAVKDAGFAMAYAEKFKVPLPMAKLMQSLFLKAQAQYGGSAWSPMVVKLLEDEMGLSLRADGFPSRLAPE